MAQKKLIPFEVEEKQPRYATVIQLSRDPHLSGLRARVLASAGLQVCSVFPDEIGTQLAGSQSPQIWIFCHSIHFHEFVALAAIVRRTHPEDKLLRLSGLDDTLAPAKLVDGSLEPPTTVEELLRAVTNADWHPALALKRRGRSSG